MARHRSSDERLAAIRLTRGSALRGLAVSALTLTGMTRLAEEASAGKKRKYCACEDENDECSTERAGRKARRQYLNSHPCAYKGTCRGTGSQNPCEGAGAPITVNVTLLGDTCTVGGTECGDAEVTGLECSATLICVPVDLGTTCDEDTDCSSGRCTNLLCAAECPEINVCESGDDAQCCVADATCISGLCVRSIDSL